MATPADIETHVCTGDYIDDGSDIYKIIGFEIYDEIDATVLLEGGGLMAVEEVTYSMVKLESEVIL